MQVPLRLKLQRITLIRFSCPETSLQAKLVRRLDDFCASATLKQRNAQRATRMVRSWNCTSSSEQLNCLSARFFGAVPTTLSALCDANVSESESRQQRGPGTTSRDPGLDSELATRLPPSCPDVSSRHYIRAHAQKVAVRASE
jgi:hypothetical protein